MSKKSYMGSLSAFAKKTAAPGLKQPEYAGFKFANLPQFISPPPAPPAPAAAAPSPYGALPIDLQSGVDTANQGAAAIYRNQVAAINSGEDRAASDYGFKVDYNTDADGNRSVANLSVDPSNPYSRAAALKKSYDQAQAGSKNSMAARGQLYSGALENAVKENGSQFASGDNQLRQGFIDFIARQEGLRTQARTDQGNTGAQALSAAISAAASRPPSDPGPRTVFGMTALNPTDAALAATRAKQGVGSIAAPKNTPGWGPPKKKKKGT